MEMSWPPLESVPSVKVKGVARAQSVGLTGPAAPTKPLPSWSWRLRTTVSLSATAAMLKM